MNHLFLSDVWDFEGASKCHCESNLLVEHAHDVLASLLAVGVESKDNWSAHENGVSSIGEALHDIGSSSSSGIDEDLCVWILRLNALCNSLKYINGRRSRVSLEVGPVRHPNGISSAVHGSEGILLAHDSLNN